MLTPLSPLRCRVGVAHFLALRLVFMVLRFLDGCASLLGALVPFRFVVVLFVVAAMLFEVFVVQVVAARHGIEFALIVGRYHRRR